MFTVVDQVEGTSLTLPTSKINHFSLPYANTCHSVQGLSLDVPITIFDVNTPYVDRYFIWTALTRATDINNVTIFQHSQKEVTDLHISRVKQYFEQKSNNYKKQDNTSARKWDKDVDEYVNADWFNDEYSKLEVKSCVACHSPFEIYIDAHGEVHSNITADRINNKLAHIQSNLQLRCIYCNCTRGNKY